MGFVRIMGPAFCHLVLLTMFILVASPVQAADPDPLQDFCIADLSQKSFLNGYPCKDPTTAKAEDFIFKGLKDASIISDENPWGAAATLAFARHWPALNTLGVALVRLDLIPGGVIAPHTHNLATEIVFVTAGELYIGFVANSDDVSAPNKLFAGMVKAGEAFVIPRGLVHFQMNKGTINASTINFLNSHNPGISFLPLTLFGAQPAVDPALLARSFAVDQTSLTDLAVFWSAFSNVFV
ncbi:protein MpCupin79 [Marchantia polymorpha subsp. ruderalis]|uniref:Germin-like protein n=2 Tax=Marchantia polymorpha TaxID=3197 RepID=A0AAF6BE81_MARPO|nr:hypothetical protein MARPO_0124s0069 [Marchantia polymorpha]BBN10315.1 hypothetical protein Mp_5g02540 [Marchantia polymorpha subsp. ruderalis]|eukprot:PTQ30504.1 hypothetical protein MARPO_0124s0069 [Marchantia polymorpha]